MKRPATAAALLGLLAILAGTPARADTIFEVEHARATARVGGPVSSYDREFLERWGEHSGTPPGWRNNTRETFELYLDDQPRRGKSRRYRD